PYTEDQLRSMIAASPIANTRLMKVTVSSSDPEEAARLANGVSAQFATFAKDRAQQLTGSYRQPLDQQLQKATSDIASTQKQIDQLQSGPNANDSATQAQITSLRTNLTDLQNTYNQLLVSANQMDLSAAGATTSVLVAQQATAPSVPYAPKT